MFNVLKYNQNTSTTTLNETNSSITTPDGAFTTLGPAASQQNNCSHKDIINIILIVVIVGLICITVALVIAVCLINRYKKLIIWRIF